MKYLILLLTLGIFGTTRAQDSTRGFNLTDCLGYARQNSPLTKRLELAKMQSDALFKIEKSKYLPHINAYADYRQLIEIPTYIFPESAGEVLSSGSSDGAYPIRIGQEFNLFAGARITQTLFDKKWLNTKKALALNSELLNLKERSLEEGLIMEISEVFFEIKKLGNQYGLITSNIENLNKVSSVIRLQYANGVVRKSEVQKMQLSLSRLETDRERLSGAIDVKTGQLKFLMGMAEGEDLTISSEDADLDKLIRRNSADVSIEMALFENRLRSGELKVKSVADNYFPKIRAFADIQYQAQRNSLSFLANEKWYPSHVVGVGVNFPVFTGLEKKAKIQLEEIKLKELALDRETTASEASLKLTNLQNELEFARQALANEKTHKELSDQLYEQVLLEYDEGVSTLSDLILASIQQIDASNLYEEAIFDYKLAQMNYLKATSGLSALLP